MKKMLVALFVALLMAGCGPTSEEQTAAKIRFAKESGSTELELYSRQITDVTPLA